jgi:heme oxygenase
LTDLAARLRTATGAMHRLAERSALMQRLLRGRLDVATYALLLRNLREIYASLEAGLDRHGESRLVGPIRFPELYRTAALDADLAALHAGDVQALPVVAAVDAYRARLAALGETQPAALVAHAYVRYMGDLSGGQLLRDIVARALARPHGGGTAFYDFPAIADVDAFKHRFRAALDALPCSASEAEAIVAEANDAFARHVAMFAELDARSA